MSQDDPDVFALLYPLDEKIRVCLQTSNPNIFIPRWAPYDVGSREATPAPVECVDLDYLELRFSNATDGKWELGRQSACEVVIPWQGISKRHCAIVLEEGGIFIEDSSTHGTSVSWMEGGFGPIEPIRLHDQYLLAPLPGIPLSWDMFVIYCAGLPFSVQLPNHRTPSPAYSENIQIAAQARKRALPALGTLGLNSDHTTLCPGTPHLTDAIFIRDESVWKASSPQELGFFESVEAPADEKSTETPKRPWRIETLPGNDLNIASDVLISDFTSSFAPKRARLSSDMNTLYHRNFRIQEYDDIEAPKSTIRTAVDGIRENLDWPLGSNEDDVEDLGLSKESSSLSQTYATTRAAAVSAVSGPLCRQVHDSHASQHLCTIAGCEGSFENNDDLQEHHKIAHIDVGRLKCKVYGCIFTDLSSTKLKNHYRSHILGSGTLKKNKQTKRITMSVLEASLGTEEIEIILSLRKSLPEQCVPMKVVAQRDSQPPLVQDDYLGEFQMSVRDVTVSMRLTDYCLSITGLFLLARPRKADSNRIRKVLARHTRIEKTKNHSHSREWVPFIDGKFVCEYLQLADELKLLLDYGAERISVQNGQSNYFFELQFHGIRVGEHEVSCQSTELWMNAGHILEAGGLDRPSTLHKLRESKKIEGWAKRKTIPGQGQHVGTYVSPSTALLLCDSYDELHMVKRELQKFLQEHAKTLQK